MRKITGIIHSEPKFDKGRTQFSLIDAGGNEKWCVSAPGFQCPTLNKNQELTLLGNHPRDLILGGEVAHFSFSEIEN
jgi:hypothetical protein